MRILITGSNGFIGSSLVGFFEKEGHTVRRLVRSAPKQENQFQWSPADGEIDTKALDGVDVVIHLAGENVFGLWTKKKKESIMSSRTKSTSLLADKICAIESPPKLFISASAVGYYGDCGDNWVDEESPQGKGFLAEVCNQWEKSSAKNYEKVRVVNLRIGIVFGKQGGPLKTMLTPFKLGIGGRVGSGKQYMSWIAIDDIIGIIQHCIEDESIAGAVNANAPNPVTNLELTKTLGRVLKRPTILPVPAFPLKLFLPKFSREVILSSTRAKPKAITKAGYNFKYTQLEEALENILRS